MSDFTEWRTEIYSNVGPVWMDNICHHQIKGAKHGVRRFQYEDGSLTPAGRERYGVGEGQKAGRLNRPFKTKKKKLSEMSDEELKKEIERNKLEKEYRESKPTNDFLSKAGDFVKSIYEQRSKNKSEAEERKLRDKELTYKENELAVKKKEAEANIKRSEAEGTKAEAEKLKQKVEYTKWDYYANTKRGRRHYSRLIKNEKIKADTEKTKAETEKKKLDKELELQRERNVATNDVFNTQRQKTLASIAQYVSNADYKAFADAFMKYKK